MKSVLINIALSALALAAPVVDLEKRQSTYEKEFTLGGCRDIIFFFARGSTEVANMGATVGPALSSALKSTFGSTSVASEGVEYLAGLSTNFWPTGADPLGVSNMNGLFRDAAARCPNSKIVASGYSQGAAVLHQAIQTLPSSVIAKIVGVVTFGDTQYVQDLGRVPNYPRAQTLIICNIGDLVCDGTLVITPAHLAYVPTVPRAASFLATQINR